MPVEEIFVKFNTEDFTAIEELKSGEIDYWSGVTPDAMKQLDGVEGVVIKDKTYPEIGFMEINTSESSIFNDVRLRQAICLAMDREAFCELTDGAAQAEYSMIIDSMMYYSEEADTHFQENYANDLDKAIALLEEAGWVDSDGDGIREKNGTKASFKIYYSASAPERQALAVGAAEQAKQFGIEIEPVGAEWDEIYPNKYSQGVLYGYGSTDPSDVGGKYYSSSPSNNARVNNSAVDAHIDAAFKESREASFKDWAAGSWDGSTGISPKGDAAWLWLGEIKYGSVTLVVQDGVVVQIERQEKIRLK